MRLRRISPVRQCLARRLAPSSASPARVRRSRAAARRLPPTQLCKFSSWKSPVARLFHEGPRRNHQFTCPSPKPLLKLGSAVESYPPKPQSSTRFNRFQSQRLNALPLADETTEQWIVLAFIFQNLVE